MAIPCCLITTDAFDLSESNISNAIYTQGSCLPTSLFDAIWSQIENKVSLKVEELSYDFLFKALREGKVRVAKDHGKKFRKGQPPLLAESSIAVTFAMSGCEAVNRMKFTVYQRKINHSH